MKTVSKQELLNLIDNHLPDDAKVALFSSMLYEVYDIDEEQMENIFATVDDVFDNGSEGIDLGDATHLIGGA